MQPDFRIELQLCTDAIDGTQWHSIVIAPRYGVSEFEVKYVAVTLTKLIKKFFAERASLYSAK
jgi:hypothetical protein